jgi:Protein of unknown function (DUF3175)
VPGLFSLGSLSGGTRSVFPAFAQSKLGASLVREAMRKPSPRTPRTRATPRKAPLLWSAEVTRRSNALDLEPGVFTWKNPSQIAASLKRSAEASDRKKTDSYRSALSMLSFYINRAGANLSPTRRRLLTRAKGELRKQFGRA